MRLHTLLLPTLTQIPPLTICACMIYAVSFTAVRRGNKLEPIFLCVSRCPHSDYAVGLDGCCHRV